MTQTNDVVEDKNEETGTLTSELATVLEDIITEETPIKEKEKRVIQLEDNLISIDKRQYLLVKNYRDAFDLEKLEERYSDVLNRYDFIVGDIGFEQLRLKGFFSEQQKRMPIEQRIGSLQDYLYEYCNFGCAYFVLERIGGKKDKAQSKTKRNTRKTKSNPKQQAHIEEKQSKVNNTSHQKKNKKIPVIKNRKEQEAKKQEKNVIKGQEQRKSQPSGKRNFTIRQKDES